MEHVRIVIVDSHKEVLPYWFKEYIDLKRPLIGVRIDEHHDMDHGCLALPAQEGRWSYNYLAKLIPYLQDFIKFGVNESNFTCLAVHYGTIGAWYHFNPREEELDAYGRVIGTKLANVPRTKKEPLFIAGKRIHRIIWDELLTKIRKKDGKTIPIPKRISLDEFRKDLQGCCLPIVIDFDLDGIYGLSDKGPKEEICEKRLEKIGMVLKCVKAPIIACIARSQTPRKYVPTEIVDYLQCAAMNLIKEIYA
jgi:hypothetical protein